MKKYNVGVAGATGLVGSTIIEVLEERKFPIGNIYFFSSKNSAGKTIVFKDKEYTVEELEEKSFDNEIDFMFFAAGGSISERYAKLAVEKGITVIDNSSVFRMDKDVPLVVPEVNPDAIKMHSGIIANPNCSTIQGVVPLKDLHEKFKIRRIVYSTYQAVSGSGLGGLRDLEEGIVEFYPYKIKGNAIPHIDIFLDNGYTKEEMKMIDETKKILNDDNIKITSTTVRIPVKHGHSISVNLEFEQPFEMEDILSILNKSKGVIVQDDIENNIYPMAIDVEGKDEVYVGRIRRDFSLDNGINLWIVADNIRKGAATNSVQIAELLT